MDSETSVYYSQNASKLAEQYATVVHTQTYADFSVPKYLTANPILGIMIEKLGGTA